MTDNILRFEFLASDHFTPTADRVSKKLDTMGERIGSVGKVAAFALGTVGVGAIAAFGYEMVKGVQSAAAYQALQLRTAAVIKSTGDVAHISVAGVDELAHKLQETSGVEEALIINSENVLATFTNIRNETGKNNDIYNQATARILDLSTAMHEDLQTATVQVGKALNDPIKGMTALSRVGVTFSAVQKTQIKDFVKSGNLMGAQKVILAELNKEFGGAAKAAGQGFGGAMSRVKNVLDDTFRNMATGLLPVLTKAADWFADKLPGAITATGKAFQVLGGWLVYIGKNFGLPAIKAIVLAYRDFTVKLHTIMPIIQAVATIIRGALGTGISILVHYFKDLLMPALRDAAAKVFPAIKNAINTLGAAFKDHMDVVRAFGNVFMFILKVLGLALAGLALLLVKVTIPAIAELIVIVLSAVGPIVRALLTITGALITVITGMVSLAIKVGKVIADVVVEITKPFVTAEVWLFKAGRAIIQGLLGGILGSIAGEVKVVAEVIGTVVRAFLPAAKWLVGAGVAILTGLVRGVLSYQVMVFKTIGSFIARYLIAPFAPAVRWLVGPGRNFLIGLLGGISSIFGRVTSAVSGFISRVRGLFAGSIKWLWQAGYNVLSGFFGGLKAIWDKVTGWIRGIASWIRDHKGPVSLDAKLLIPAGRAIMNGFLNGLKSGAGAAWTFVKTVGGKTVAELQSILSGVGSALGMTGGIAVQGGGNGANRAIGQKMASFYGWTGNQWAALNNLWMGESGWNNFARNPSSGAFGIPQALPPGKMGSAAASGDATAQIAWGLNYIRSVYGSPANAYAQWLARSPHWYDAGGLAGGAGWFRKGPAPERILSPMQTKWFERAMRSAGGHGGSSHGGMTIILNAPNYIGSRDELLRELNRMARQGRLDSVVKLAS